MKKLFLLLATSVLSVTAMAQGAKIEPPVIKPVQQPVIFTLHFTPQELQVLGQIIDNSNAPHSNVVAITSIINKQLTEQSTPPAPPADKQDKKEVKEDKSTEPEKK